VINKGIVRTVAIVTGLALLCMGVTLAADERSAIELVEKARDMWRGETFHAVVSIEVTRDERTDFQRVEVWGEGEDRALVRVLEPEDEAGSGYLLLEDDKLWFYDHQAQETIELPGFALFDGFLGSGLDLDELLRGTVTEHYEVSFSDEQPEEGYKVDLVPLPGAPVAYGQLRLLIDERFVIRNIDYYDFRGNVVKRAHVPEVLELEERTVPKVWIVEEEVGDKTVATYEELSIDEPLPEDIFTLENLTQP